MKLTTFICVALMASPAFAEKKIVSRDEYCAAVANVAEAVMTARQAGFPIGETLEMTADVGKGIRQLVIDAYDMARFSSDEIRAEVILDFSNDIHLQCLTTDDFI